MNDHDICCTEDDGQEVTVVCNCGLRFTRTSKADAEHDHDGHFHIMQVRADTGIRQRGDL